MLPGTLLRRGQTGWWATCCLCGARWVAATVAVCLVDRPKAQPFCHGMQGHERSAEIRDQKHEMRRWLVDLSVQAAMIFVKHLETRKSKDVTCQHTFFELRQLRLNFIVQRAAKRWLIDFSKNCFFPAA